MAGRCKLVLRPFEDAWDPAPTARCHTTWDDFRGRGRCAATLLRRLRMCGDWELVLCHFVSTGKSSFAGGVFSPHIDLVHHPKCTQQHGIDVVRHLAARLVQNAPEPLDAKPSRI